MGGSYEILPVLCQMRLMVDLNYQVICQNMSASAEPVKEQKHILIRAYQCKIKTKFNLQEFLDILNTDPKLTKMTDKSLFMLYLCELLLKAFVNSGLRIRNFITEFDKKDVKKEKRRGTGETRNKKRTNKNQRGRGGKTLEELSNQSLSNPSNVERPRTNVDNRQEESANQVPQSKEKGDDSQGSKDNSSKNQLKIELNKITEEIKGQEDTYVQDIDFAPNTQIEDNSQTTSQQTGEISNLSEKIKIFTNVKESERKMTTTRRKVGNNGNLSRETRTKKKKFDIFDQSTFIEETRATDNDLTLNYNQTSHFDTQEVMDMDLVNNFLESLEGKDKENEIKVILFEKAKIQEFRSIIHFDQPFVPHQGDHNSFIMPMEEGNELNFPDYTMSQPTSAPLFEPDFFKESLEIKDSEFNFDELVNHSTKDKSVLFYQLLWREQNDEIRLFQQSPQTFSKITVKHG